jgi:FMN reductase (NADPH)
MLDNPTLQLIRSHGSVRHYKPDPLPVEMVETIVAAGQRASTSSNLQTYSVIAVTDPEKRSRLAALCGDQVHIAEAPLFLAWCADLARLDRACQLRGYMQIVDYLENFLVAAVDAAIAAQNAALAAQSLGLGICYIGSIRNNPQDVIELLGLPRLVFPITGMTLGWPVCPPIIRPRLPMTAILHWGCYNSEQDAALLQYDAEMAATGIYQNRQVSVPGKEGEMESYGWLEHSALRASQPRRTELRRFLEKQGFLIK